MTKLIYILDLCIPSEEYQTTPEDEEIRKEAEAMVINVRMAPGMVKWIDDYIEKTRRFKSRSEFISFAVTKNIQFILEYEDFVEYTARDKSKKKPS